MAARAGSVHLISSMDRKPSRKGGARPRPKQPHPVPQGPPFSIKCLLTTGCPPEALNQSQLKHTASSRPKHTQTLGGRSATPPTQELTSFQSSPHFLCGRSNNTSLQPHPLQTIVSFRPAVRSPPSHRRTVPH